MYLDLLLHSLYTYVLQLFGVLLTSFGIILIIYRPVGIYYCFLIFILIGLILLLISNIALRGISKESIALLIIVCINLFYIYN